MKVVTLLLISLFFALGAHASSLAGFYRLERGDETRIVYIGEKFFYDRANMEIKTQPVLATPGGEFGSLVKTIERNNSGDLEITLKDGTRYYPEFVAQDITSTLVVAHRGLCSDKLFPCNTLEAFEYAFLTGYKAIELDVKVTLDKKFIVTHDEKLKTSTHCKGKVKDYTLAELETCEVYRSNRIPEVKIFGKKSKVISHLVSLKTVLKRFLIRENLKKIVIDVKPDSGANIVIAARDSFSGFTKEQLKKILIISRDLSALKQLKSFFPEIQIALEGSTGTEPYKNTSSYLLQAKTNYDVVSLNTGVEFAGGSFFFGSGLLLKSIFKKGTAVKLISAYLENKKRISGGLSTIAWTVNNDKIFKLLVNSDVEFIISDRPYYELAQVLLKNHRSK